MSHIQPKGSLFIVSAPSGAGKSTLLDRLRKEDPRLVYSISHTTRAPRGKEQDGEAYYFVDRPSFQKLIEQDAFLEYALVHDHYYGTSREPVVRHLKANLDVVVDIDVAGAAQIRERMPEAVSIFILPPDLATLRQRLQGRGEDKPETIAKRLDNAAGEMARVDEYDYVVVNDDLDQCLTQMRAIIHASRCRYTANQELTGTILAGFVDNQ